MEEQAVFNPIGDKVMLMYPQEGRIEDGIYVAAESVTRMDALVVGVGRSVKADVHVGDTVIADRLSGIQVVLDGVKYRLVPESAVEAVYEMSGSPEERRRTMGCCGKKAAKRGACKGGKCGATKKVAKKGCK